MKTNDVFHYLRRGIAFALPISSAGVVNMGSFIAMIMVALLGKVQLGAGTLLYQHFAISASLIFIDGIMDLLVGLFELPYYFSSVHVKNYT